MPTRLLINAGLPAQIEVQAAFEAELNRQAHVVRDAVENAARVIPDFEDGGWMPRHGHEWFEVQDLELVVNTDYAGHMQEWGSRHNPPYAPLRRGARASGLRLG